MACAIRSAAVRRAFEQQLAQVIVPGARGELAAGPGRMAGGNASEHGLDVEPLERLDEPPHPGETIPLVVLADEHERRRRLRRMPLEAADEADLHVDVTHPAQRPPDILIGVREIVVGARARCREREQLADASCRDARVVDRVYSAVVDAVQLSSEHFRLLIEKGGGCRG